MRNFHKLEIKITLCLFYLRGYISHNRNVKFGSNDSVEQSYNIYNHTTSNSVDSNSSSDSSSNNSSSDLSDSSESSEEEDDFYENQEKNNTSLDINDDMVEADVSCGQVSHENTKSNMSQKYNIFYDLATNDGDTMNDFLIDIMEEIEAENITVEECAEALEKSGHLTIDEVLLVSSNT